MQYYYRYRSDSMVSIKELIYHELYLGTVDENNDPYDSFQPYEFPANHDMWVNLIKIALERSKLGKAVSTEAIDRMAGYACAHSPMSIPEALLFDYARKSGALAFLGLEINHAIWRFIKEYEPSNGYFAAFSKTGSDPLMWSHYASMYKGYCLIFKPFAGRIQVKGKIGHYAGNSFPLEDVVYQDDVIKDDAFLLFPQAVSNLSLSQEEIDQLNERKYKYYRTKAKCWDYEQEARVVYTENIRWLTGDLDDIPSYERLLHYNPDHLVGVILGPRMNPAVREQVIHAVKKVQEEKWDKSEGRRVLFDMVIHEAKLSTNKKELEIVPQMIINPIKTLLPGDPQFEECYSKWRDHIAMEFTESGSGNGYHVID